jgi:isoquinoline 1-oxidoreductase alpha subunit
MQAIALLSRNHHPTDEQIEAQMSPILCRCGTYQRIAAAVRQAAKEMA